MRSRTACDSAYSKAQWARVTKSSPCPLCERDSWCTIDTTDGTVKCMRTKSDEPVEKGGWLHRHDGVRPIPRPKPERKSPNVDWRALADKFAGNITDEQIDMLAEQLGVDPIALRELGIGHDGVGYTFPMFDGSGAVCGIRRRMPDGGKKSYLGSRNGIFRRLEPDDGVLFVNEGDSDPAAGITIGLDCIGVPGAGQCADVVAEYAAGRDVVIVADNDEAGRDGAARIYKCLREDGRAKSVVTVSPPADHKDLRDWVRAGARAEDVHALVDAARSTSSTSTETEPKVETAKPERSPIETLFAPVGAFVFREPPAPRRYLVRYPTKDGEPCPPGQGDGKLPRGKLGLFTAEGGAGKTLSVMELAVCAVTGRPWFGHYPADAEGGSVAMMLGEEDVEEVHRRLWSIGRAMQLTAEEQDQVGRRIVIIPLAGKECALTQMNAARRVVPSAHHAALVEQLNGAGVDWALVVLDPLSRFAGVPIDVDNHLATRVVQVFESLVQVRGNPTVLALCHSSKFARREGTADTRGATALTDGVRWVASLTNRDGGGVEYRQTKSNYSRPMPIAMALERGPEGVLRAVGAVDQSRADLAKAEREIADREAILTSLRAVGKATSIDAIVTGAGLRAQRGRGLVRRMIDEGLIDVRGTSRSPVYTIAEGPLEEGSERVCENSPYPTGRRTPSARVPRDDVPNEWDAEGTVGTPDDGQAEQPKGRRRRRAGGAA